MATEVEFSSSKIAKEEYSHIAEDYAQSKSHPWRILVEEHSLRRLVESHVASLPKHHVASMLDLACGHGHYTRKLVAEWGLADSACGVDISAEMISLARQTTARLLPDDVTRFSYFVADATLEHQFFRDIPGAGGRPFDVCVAAYLLNYASSKEQLLAMCRTIRANLHPQHGVFITLNDGPLQPLSSFPLTEKYGFRKVLRPEKGEIGEGEGEVPDFTPLTYQIFQDPFDPRKGFFEFTNYRISPETFEWAFKEAGFSSFRIVPLVAAEEEEFFEDFVRWGPVALFEVRV